MTESGVSGNSIKIGDTIVVNGVQFVVISISMSQDIGSFRVDVVGMDFDSVSKLQLNKIKSEEISLKTLDMMSKMLGKGGDE